MLHRNEALVKVVDRIVYPMQMTNPRIWTVGFSSLLLHHEDASIVLSFGCSNDSRYSKI